ncbi:MAG: hypothetical protein A3F72_01085 [Bacteroidetes bacterium RIFCSPLOWO2_12_FULL_35_15]|nr:MAG: hypothetical protein A3F72_01085 [Bacteroidetes bacterium RIFCSPLOWO2_12_FULL_35_15]
MKLYTKKMKTKLLLICGFIFSLMITTKAQTITLANSQIIGDSIIVYRSDTLGLYQGASGVGVTWDFSTLNNIGTVYRYTMDPSSTPYPTLYPSSNRAEKTISGTSTNYQFYNTQNDSTTIVGTSGGVIDSTIYSNTDKAMIFPFTYLNTFYDSSISFAYYNTSGIKNHSYHSRTTTADGSGTLILPNATYTNVLRYKIIHYEVDSLFSGTNFISKSVWNIEEYIWVDAGHRAYLLYANPLKKKNGVQQAKSVHYVTNPPLILPTEIQPIYNPLESTVIYPNPAKNVLNINCSTTGSVTIFNTFGQVVLKAKLTNDLDISGLMKGFYFVQLSNDQNEIVMTKKIIKE